jgi:hypothetical protein
VFDSKGGVDETRPCGGLGGGHDAGCIAMKRGEGAGVGGVEQVAGAGAMLPLLATSGVTGRKRLLWPPGAIRRHRATEGDRGRSITCFCKI